MGEPDPKKRALGAAENSENENPDSMHIDVVAVDDANNNPGLIQEIDPNSPMFLQMVNFDYLRRIIPIPVGTMLSVFVHLNHSPPREVLYKFMPPLFIVANGLEIPQNFRSSFGPLLTEADMIAVQKVHMTLFMPWFLTLKDKLQKIPFDGSNLWERVRVFLKEYEYDEANQPPVPATLPPPILMAGNVHAGSAFTLSNSYPLFELSYPPLHTTFYELNGFGLRKKKPALLPDNEDNGDRSG